MHVYLMFVLVVAFVVLVVYLAKVVVLQLEETADNDVMKVKEAYFGIIQRKDDLAQEKKRLQEEANRIFTLYEFTREVTGTFDEAAAFQSFRAHLARQTSFEDCRMLPVPRLSSPSPEKYQGYRFFSLKAKRKVLGELAYKGLPEQDEEIFVILAHQFALALKRIRLYNELEKMAITDGLTQLHTRRHFMERFAEEFGRAQLRQSFVSFLMIDLDHFKQINDRYGHLTGDVILRETARLIDENIREIDIAGRYGGEEFCVILPDTDKAGAMLTAERIRSAVCEAKIRAFDAVLTVTLSIGVATFPDDARQSDELLDKADWAMYRAKKKGRDQVAGFSIYQLEA